MSCLNYKGEFSAQIVFLLNFLAEFLVGYIEKTVKEGTKDYNSIVGLIPKEGLAGLKPKLYFC